MITNVTGSNPLQGQPIGRGSSIGNQGNASARTYSPQELAFEQLLKQRLSEQEKSSTLQFSKHATQRIEQRGIIMDTQKMSDLTQAVEKARSKGARDVVVIGRDEAYIVNVPNNTVITTVSGSEMKENIFTNIDSAVIL